MLQKITRRQFEWWFVEYLKRPWGFGDMMAAQQLAVWTEKHPADFIPWFVDDNEEDDAAAAQVAAIRSRALSQKVD